MRPIQKIKFSSAFWEQEITKICRVHGLDLSDVERSINSRYFLVEPGSVDPSLIEIGKDRVLENPSGRLSQIVHACLSGRALARDAKVNRRGFSLKTLEIEIRLFHHGRQQSRSGCVLERERPIRMSLPVTKTLLGDAL